MTSSTLLELAVCGVAVGTAAVTVAESGAFGWLRVWMLRRVIPLGRLLSCYYCLAHWFAAGVLALVPSRLAIAEHAVADAALTWLVVTACGATAGKVLR